MKITVEIGENWLDDECIEEGLRRLIQQDVIRQIKESIDSKIEVEITKQVKEKIEKTMNTKIRRRVEAVLKKEKIISNGQEYTIEEYIKYMFEKGNSFNRNEDYNPKEIINNMASQFSKELKQRYDLLFASQIVNKMSENNLVRKDVAELLLEPKNEE